MCRDSYGKERVSDDVSGILAIVMPICGVRGCVQRYLRSLMVKRILSQVRILIILRNSGSNSTRVTCRFIRRCPSALQVVCGTGNNRNSTVGANLVVTSNRCIGVLSDSS